MIDTDREFPEVVGDEHEGNSSGDGENVADADREIPEVGGKRKHEDDEDENEDDEDMEEEDDDDQDLNDGEKKKKEEEEEKGGWHTSDQELLEYFDYEGDPEYEKRLINEVFPKYRKYFEQLIKSKGFDIKAEDWPGHILGITPIVPLKVCKETCSDFVESEEVYHNLSKLALSHYNNEHGTAYEDAKYVNVNLEIHSYLKYYLTFTALDPNSSSVSNSKDTSHAGAGAGGSDDNNRVTFQSKITHYMIGGQHNHKPEVEYCRVKPETTYVLVC